MEDRPTEKLDLDAATREQLGQKSAVLGIASFSIRYPVTICVIFVLISTFGVIAIGRIPLELLPAMDYPFLNIWVPYENASPGQVLESITKPLEEVLSTIPGVEEMSARAGSDFTSIRLNFPWGHDITAARNEVREKIDQVRSELPNDVARINIWSWSSEDSPILSGMIASERDLSQSGDLLDLVIKKPLERIPGVAEAEMWGAQFKEIDVYLRLNDLKRYRIDVDRLFRRLDTLNANRSLGRVEDSGYEFSTIFRSAMDSIADIENYPVNDRGLLLKDIADIVYDHPEVNWGRHLNGRQSLGFGIKKNSNANTVEVVNRVKEELEKIRQDPRLEGLDILVWRDSASDIIKSLNGLLSAGSIGALLAVVVLLGFVRRLVLTVVIGLAIPFSIIAAIGFLYLADKTLNSMTMLGLILAAGMLVDNAVVVLESIYQKLEKGMERRLAAQLGTREVATAVIAATLTSIIIFVPLIFGELNDFTIRLAHTGVSIIFAVICSLFISLTLIPLAMARLLRIDVNRRVAWQQWSIDRFSSIVTWFGRQRRGGSQLKALSPRKTGHGRITEGYLLLVQWPIRYRFLVGLVLVPTLIGASAWLLINKIPDNTPEAQDLNWISIQYDFSENYHYAKIEEDYVNRVEEFLLSNRERLNITDVESGFGNNSAWTWVYFDKEKMTLQDVQKTNQEITEGLPVIAGAKISLGQGSGRNQNWISANLYGDDPNILQDLAKQVRGRLLARPDFTSVYTDRRGAEEEVQIRLNRDRARRLGISADSVSQVLFTVMRGRRIRGYRTAEGEVDIWIRLQAGDREDLSDLASLVIGRGPEGQAILLSQVADLPLQRVPGVVRRQDRRTTTWLTAVYSGAKRAEGKRLMEDALNLLDFPEGYGWNYGFWTQREEEGERAFVFNILLALFMVYFVMASLFESFTHPLAIMFSLPFAVFGVVLLLMITGAPFNWMAKVGSLVLVGIVVNNGIILIDHINNLRRKGLPRSQAILEGCRERLRPIAMTASTTVVSLIPLAFGTSGMLNMRYFPMAQTLMGGMMVSTVLTLIVLPTYYTLFDDLARWVKQIWQVTNPSRDKAAFSARTVPEP